MDYTLPTFNPLKEALLIYPEGERQNPIEVIKPQNLEEGFQLKELYAHIQCELIEIVQLAFTRNKHPSMILIVDEEGKIVRGKKFNSIASQIYANPRDIIRGRAVYCHTTLVQ